MDINILPLFLANDNQRPIVIKILSNHFWPSDEIQVSDSLIMFFLGLEALGGHRLITTSLSHSIYNFFYLSLYFQPAEQLVVHNETEIVHSFQDYEYKKSC